MKNKQTIFVIGLATLLGAMIFVICLSVSGFFQFMRYQKHVSALKCIGMAFSEYHDEHHVFPIESQDDLWSGGWRKHLYDSRSIHDVEIPQDAWEQVLEGYALLVPLDSPWLDGVPQSVKDLRERYGLPVVVIQLPKDLQERRCSALILDSEHQQLRLRDETEFPLTILRDVIGLRSDCGSTILIPREATAERILQILKDDDRY